MSPSGDHERIKKILARLVEAFAEERGIPLNGFGSWTLRDRIAERGAEPDECYVLGTTDQTEVPDLVIEVRWTRGGLDKLEIYRGLGVRELWIWQDGAIGVFVLSGGRYATASSSLLLPELDLVGLSRFLEMDDQTEAVRTFRALVRSGPAL